MASSSKTTECITYFKSLGFNLWNVSAKKVPITYDDKPICKWSELPTNFFHENKIHPNKNIGFLSGQQFQSNKNIIILDFDIKTKEGIDQDTLKLYQDFCELDKENNPNKYGYFKSSSCDNFGIILDITNNNSFIDYLKDYGCKVGDGLEVLIKNNVVLPPSKTICKSCATDHQSREFICGKPSICYLTNAIEVFIKTYIDNFKNISILNDSLSDKIITQKFEYYKKLITLFAINKNNKDLKQEKLNDIIPELIKIFKSNEFRHIYEIPLHKTFNLDEDKVTNHLILKYVNMVFNDFGFQLKFKRKQEKKLPVIIYSLHKLQIIENYLLFKEKERLEIKNSKAPV